MHELLPFTGRVTSEPPTACFVRVVVERGIDDKSGVEGLTYRSRWADLAVGERVEVPLGKGGKVTGGVVVAVGGEELLDGLAPGKAKPVASRHGAQLPPALVELAQWIAGYTISPLGLVLSAIVPAAVKKGIGRRSEHRLAPVQDPAAAQKLGPALREVWGKVCAMEPGAFPILTAELTGKLGETSTRNIRKLITAGLLKPVEQSEVRGRGASPTEGNDAAHRALAPEPTPAQSAIIEGIGATLGRFGVHLLRGVTGSGKTEVYLRLITRVLEQGKGAIVLVPEIALTPQTQEWFKARLSHLTGVAVLHSGMSASHRHAEWDRVSRGEARVAIGPRSAVFAPVRGLGLIVVDEEHEHSYKHEQLPRYNARDVAIKRGQIEGCPVLLGSATPSLESWANATGPSPKSTLWHLTQRVGGGRLPKVEIVDIAAERRVMAQSGVDPFRRSIGPTLQGAIGRTLDEGGQVILLLNRRGYASTLACPSPACGWVLRCESCDAAMVFHKDRALPKGGLVRCHHCLAEQLVPGACPACNRPVSQLGSGTQRIEEELISLFGESHGLTEQGGLIRVDSDTMGGSRDYFSALSRFASGEVRVMLGTQMIAKGLDFPNVRLVGVVSADTGLNLPDFRSGERTFQLVSQVAGRAGRGEHAGRVIVQTLSPTCPPIVLAAQHDYVTFADQELEMRRASKLPPAVRMARIVCRDQDAGEARTRAAALVDKLKESPGVWVAGPMEATISRIAGYYRWAVEVYSPTAAGLQSALTTLRSAGMLKSDSRTAVDVDPLTLL